ncbi:MAG: hydroxysqualene dehydroxylase HpnE [Pirellulales bacterium]
MSSRAADDPPKVTVVGGGLAGLAAAVALAASQCQVELFEARRTLGGRAGSFRDPATGEMVDHCQHVSMGCCTNLADFCRRTGIAPLFRRDRRLHFVGPDGRHYDVEAGRLPPPFHLAPAFWRLTYLSASDRLRIGRALWKLMRRGVVDSPEAPSIGRWLRGQGQSDRAIERFWSVILVSALGEELDRASLAAARKVLVDGFLAAREAYVVEVPQAPLSTLYGERLERWFADHGVRLHLNAPIRKIACDAGPLVVRADGREVRPDFVVIALPWFKIGEVVDERLALEWPWLGEISSVAASPITGVHLWFDRPIMSLDHAVLVGRLSQWIFNRTRCQGTESSGGYYYQVVVSASRELGGKDRDAIVREVCRELAQIWPVAGQAKLLRARVVTEHAAVFSARPGLERWRPAQQTQTGGVLVAGDWTATGWPATMESAVRSGYLAAEAITESIGRPARFLVDDLPRGRLARWLIRD